MIKNVIDAASAKKAVIRQKAIVFGGTAVGAILAYAMLSKANANEPNIEVFAEEATIIINDSKDTPAE